MARVYNFSAGPSQLPEPVLRKAATELLEYGTTGQSVMEMSHRSPEYEAIINECEALIRSLLGVPENYKVLFLQGGASSQFAMVPMNLCKNGKADYVVTGLWGKKAFQEGGRFLKARELASSADRNFTYIPEIDPAAIDPEADFLHICYNNTIYGSCFTQPPESPVPLVADMSSCIFSQPIDVSRFGIIYAGAQKNLGPAGVTVAIVREDLIGDCMPGTPAMFQYKIHAENGSMYNTPPTYTIYICKLVLEWLRDEIGGLEKMYAYNQQKAAVLYNYLDSSSLFRGTVEKPYRSLMNIPFVTGDAELDKAFVKQAAAEGFINLKGHRSVGGMRASIYNAMPIEGVEKLVDCMKRFGSSRG